MSSSPVRPATAAGIKPRTIWRFTIADLLIVFVGLGGALSVVRLPGLSWYDGLLGAFAVWFLCKCWSAAWELARAFAPDSARFQDAAPCMFAAVAGYVLAPLAVVLGTILHCAGRAGHSEMELDDFLHGQAFALSCLALVIVPTISVVQPYHLYQSNREVFTGRLINVVATILAIGVIIAQVSYLLILPVLIHIAIDGVRVAQPFRRGGMQYTDGFVDDRTAANFACGAFIAASLWLATAWQSARLARAIKSRLFWLRPELWLVILLAALTATLAWGHREFRTSISPILGPFLLSDKPAILFWLGLAVAVVVACWATRQILCNSAETYGTLTLTLPARHKRPYDTWVAVSFIAVAWAVIARLPWILPIFWQNGWRFFWESLQYIATDTEVLFMLAAVCVWLQIARNYRRGYDDRTVKVTRATYAQLISIWLAALGVTVTAAPVFAWLSFVLWTWRNQFPGEAWLLFRR